MSAPTTPPSLSDLLFGLGDVRDVEGRPLAERRASSEAKRGCPMELVPCPYDDERHGIAMNASALEQIKGHLRAVHTDVSAFHRTLPDAVTGHERLALAVIDQLAGPARACVAARGAPLVISGPVATGYKLAAGLFDLTMRLQDARARGARIEADLDTLLETVRRERALVGGGGLEACAGPPRLIRRTTAVFLGLAASEETGTVEPLRPALAQLLHAQLELGTAFRRFDARCEREVLALARDRMTPRNDFVRDKLARALADLEPALEGDALASARLPAELEPSLLDGILACCAADGALDAEAVRALRAAAQGPASALTFDDDDTGERLAQLGARYFGGYRAFLAALWHLEQSIRGVLSLDLDAPTVPGALIFPRSRALGWLEAITGRKLVSTSAARPTLSLRGRDGVIEIG